MYIFGASGHGKVIASILLANNIDVNGFIDDNPRFSKLLEIPVFKTTDAKAINLNQLIVGIGDNAIRREVANKFNSSVPYIKHPSAQVCNSSNIDKGTVVFPLAVVNSEVKIGKHCIINSGAVVEHDCVLKDYVHISPNASLGGNVRVGEGSHVGIGASVIQGITIGKWSTIGAGAVIIRDVPDNAIMVGNPARNIK